jgi:hypothetical protein
VFTTADFLRFIAVILALPGAFFFIRAIGRAKSSRTATYYATRRQAAHASNRDLSSFVIIAIMATGLAIISIFLPSEITTTEPPAIIVTSSPTFRPTLTVAVTSSTRATAITPAPSPTPFATALRVTPTEKPTVTDSSAHKLVLRAISQAITANGLPISPTTEFTKGVTSIYVIYDYVGIQQSAVIRQVWLRDGNSVYYDSSTWSRTGTGSGYLTWSPMNGFDPGLYEVRITLGDLKQFSANFMVQ